MNRPNATDRAPWYRQFWPWFLITLPAVVVMAGLGTFYIAHQHADDLVVDQYYREGLAINRNLQRQENARERGIATTFTLSGRRLRVHLTGAVDDPELLLNLFHPLEADRDASLVLQHTAPGTWEGEVPSGVTPRWHWTLEPAAGDWLLTGTLSAADFDDGRPR